MGHYCKVCGRNRANEAFDYEFGDVENDEDDQDDEDDTSEFFEIMEQYTQEMFGEIWISYRQLPKSGTLPLSRLLELRRSQNLKGMLFSFSLCPRGKSKKVLIPFLLEHLPAVTDHFLRYGPELLIALWDKVMDQGGVLHVPDAAPFPSSLMAMAMTKGLFFPFDGKSGKVLMAPSDHLERYPAEERNRILVECVKVEQQRNCMISLLETYGIYPLDDLLRLMGAWTKKPVDIDTYLQIHSLGNPESQLDESSNILERDGVFYAYSMAVEDPEALLDSQMESGVPYRSFRKEEILEQVDLKPQGFVALGYEFVDFLEKTGLDEESANDIWRNFSQVFREEQADGAFWESVNDQLKMLPQEQKRILMRKLDLLHDHTPRYGYKGHSAYEYARLKPERNIGLRSLARPPLAVLGSGDVEQQKVHPNNFCPCGSGKKYKKCCMPKA